MCLTNCTIICKGKSAWVKVLNSVGTGMDTPIQQWKSVKKHLNNRICFIVLLPFITSENNFSCESSELEELSFLVLYLNTRW